MYSGDILQKTLQSTASNTYFKLNIKTFLFVNPVLLHNHLHITKADERYVKPFQSRIFAMG